MVQLFATGGFATLATKKTSDLQAAMTTISKAVGDPAAMVQLFATGGFATLATKKTSDLQAAMTTISAAVGGPAMVKLFGRSGVATFAMTKSESIATALQHLKKEFGAFSLLDVAMDICCHSYAKPFWSTLVNYANVLGDWYQNVASISDDEIQRLCPCDENPDPQLARYSVYRGFVTQLVTCKKLVKMGDEKQVAHVEEVTQTLAHLPETGPSPFFVKMRKSTFGKGIISRETRVKDSLAEYVRTRDVKRQSSDKYQRGGCESKENGADILASFKETTRHQVRLDIEEHKDDPTPLSLLLAEIVRERQQD
jgi:hypothetical protein